MCFEVEKKNKYHNYYYYFRNKHPLLYHLHKILEHKYPPSSFYRNLIAKSRDLRDIKVNVEKEKNNTENIKKYFTDSSENVQCTKNMYST